MTRYREISTVFPIYAHVKVVTPRAGPNLTPGLFFWALLVEAHYMQNLVSLCLMARYREISKVFRTCKPM